MKFKDLLERKQVGNIYHFTKIENLYGLLFNNDRYSAEVLEFISFNDTFSCTRDSCLANNPVSRDINIKNGHNVRIVLDGDKISDKYKIKPHNGLNDNEPFKTKDNEYVGKEYEEREEQVYSKKYDSFKMKDFIKKIDILNDAKNSKINIDKITKKINLLNIKYEFVRKFHRVSMNETHTMNESHELYLEMNCERF